MNFFPFNIINGISTGLETIIFDFTSPELQARLLVVRIVFLFINAVLIGLIIFLLNRTHYMHWLFIEDVGQFFSMRPYGAKQIDKQWNKILKRLETDIESERKLAIMEADDVLGAALKRLGHAGETLDEKLKNLTSATLPNIQGLLEAHRLRDSVVHDPDYRLPLDETKKALDVYAQAFRDLQILG